MNEKNIQLESIQINENTIPLESIQMNVYNDCKKLEFCRLVALDTYHIIESTIFCILNLAASIFSLLIVFLFLYPETEAMPLYIDIIVAIAYCFCRIYFRVWINDEVDKLNTSYDNLKLETANIYFGHLNGFDKMEQWAKDKVFKESILPYTGLQSK